MKNKISGTDVVLMTLWGALAMNASSINPNGLMFGWSIQTHLTITAALIAGRMFYKNFFARTNA